MRILVVLTCLLGLLGALPAHASGLEDVFGREVPLGQGRPALVLYGNRDTRGVLREHAMQFAYELRREHPIVVVHVDLRGIPGFFMGAATRELRRIHAESLDKVRELFRSQGQDPPADLEDSLYMVADSNGAPHRALGLDKGFQQVLVQAMSATGRELARGPFPQATDTIRRALEASAAQLVSAFSR
ncbi:hypothetical protein [Vitiosangium sp. GDMCC 1.1324]|uniref:hypothetical protein n=1 Tax=Vitiosangium sp. (strain GDMCC 1.1324) TaxID=2138576 RepID=UPI000D3544DB|nr:hypothetical protein [Vitiosangium sp. GDMCC 1.1324]PTL80875.1 hypothetical protein DAT35_26450 [Vitiosangium sp. GDMCC 1.1324]